MMNTILCLTIFTGLLAPNVVKIAAAVTPEWPPMTRTTAVEKALYSLANGDVAAKNYHDANTAGSNAGTYKLKVGTYFTRAYRGYPDYAEGFFLIGGVERFKMPASTGDVANTITYYGKGTSQIECNGFALMVFNHLYPSVKLDSLSWGDQNSALVETRHIASGNASDLPLSSLNPGTAIYNRNHSIIIYARDSSYIWVYDANSNYSDGNNIIRLKRYTHSAFATQLRTWFSGSPSYYYYVINAKNQSVTPGDTTVPNVVTELRVVQETSTSAKLTWKAPTNTPISHYRIQYSNNNSSWYDETPATTTSTSFVSTGLVTYDTYYYRIRAVGTNGIESVWMDTTYTKPHAVTPNAATDLNVVENSSTSAKLSWKAPTNTPISHYRIQYSVDNALWYDETPATTTSTSYICGVRGSYDKYYYRVKAIGTNGKESGWASIVYTKPKTFSPGDVDQNGVITSVDIAKLVDFVESGAKNTRILCDIESYPIYLADLDGNGSINSIDIAILVDKVENGN